MLLGEVLKNVKYKNIEFINIDDNSTQEQQDIGRKICNENNILFMQNNGRGLFAATNTVIEFVSENRKDCEFVYWLTHDCYPIFENFFDNLYNLIEGNKISEFGTIGFNTIWRKFSMDKLDFIKNKLSGKYCGAMGRAVLTKVPGAGWYRSSDFEMKWDTWGKVIAVESVVDMNMMINVKKYKSHIDPDFNFHHFCWGDDLGLQFLKNNIYNITLPNLYVYHDQSLKKKYDIPENSLRAAQSGDDYYFCNPTQHLEHWEKKWGFDRNWQKNNVKNLYSILDKFNGTIINDFVKHDYKSGPLKIFNV